MMFRRAAGAAAVVFCQFVASGAGANSPPSEAAVAAPGVAGTVAQAHARSLAARWNDTARLLAGLTIGESSELAGIRNRPSFARHRRELDQAWAGFVDKRLGQMQRFAAREVTSIGFASGPVYYPFSGPDALHSVVLFPLASEFIFTGLEPVGEIPDLGKMDEATLRESLFTLRRSVASSLAASFFKTHEMKVDLVRNQLEGVTPIILLFLARQDMQVNGVEPFIVDGSGAVREVTPDAQDNLAPGEVAGVRVRFQKPGESRERRIHYLSADVSDSGLAKTPVYLEWVRRAQTQATMIKSASYLMHADAFSKIRAFIVERSQLLVQDDSGIPVRFFASDGWTRRFYGQYNGPIPMFNNRMQKDLKAAFVTEGAMPIDFSYGYHFRDRGNNIQRYIRKVAVAAER